MFWTAKHFTTIMTVAVCLSMEEDMKIKKYPETVLIIALLAIFSMSFLLTGFTANAAGKADEIVVLGAGLNESQRIQTLELLEVDPESGQTVNMVTGADAERYIGVKYSDTAMISSVKVEFLDKNNGVSTEIVTPDRISKVKSYQYSNAAITAGIYDTLIVVAAVSPVTGNSALTGVYKAAEIYGIELDADKLEAGNDELITVQIIEDNNAGNAGYDSEEFSKALTEIKGQIAELVEKEGKDNVTIEEITVIVNNVLQQYNINISQADIDRLTSTLEKFKNTISAEDVQKILEQLQTFGEKTWGMALDLIDRAKAEGWWQQLVDFFRKLFEVIADFFRRVFSHN